MNAIERCKKHTGLIIIERVIVENFVTFDEDGNPPEDSDDWMNNPVQWYGPQERVIIVTCSDCGFEQFYGPRAKFPKWVQEAWDKLLKVQCR